MRKILLLIISLSLFAKESYSLNVVVDKLRNSKGEVIFSLYNKDGSLPDEKLEKYFKQKKASIEGTTSKVMFDNLEEGDYAIFMVHDENKNGKIDKGFLLPTEGVGVSNFDTINILHKPNFKKASFRVDKNKIIIIKPIYF